jgi:hypothetical protein
MTNRKQQWRPYLDYLTRLADKHEAKGEPMPDVCGNAYWTEWRALHEAASKHDERQD